MTNNKLLLDKNSKQLVYKLIEYAETYKRNCPENEKQYWQGRADMGRLIQAIIMPGGIAWGIRSKANEDLLSDSDHDLIDLLIARGK